MRGQPFVGAHLDAVPLRTAVVLAKLQVPLAGFLRREPCVGHTAHRHQYVRVRLFVAVRRARAVHVDLTCRPIVDPRPCNGLGEREPIGGWHFARDTEQDLSSKLRVCPPLACLRGTPESTGVA